jgi:hypothetical protein
MLPESSAEICFCRCRCFYFCCCFLGVILREAEDLLLSWQLQLLLWLSLLLRYPKASALGLYHASKKGGFSPWGMPSHQLWFSLQLFTTKQN